MKFLLFSFGGGEILLIALVVILLFGGTKIPELMRGLGKGVRSFKEGLNGVEEAPDASKRKLSDHTDENTSTDKNSEV
jgi:sec-independent protein translocase protein TatA